jgi:hypothetical protein
VSSFLFGGLGALAPEVIRWFRIAKDETPSEWKRRSYWVATILYVALGGGFASLVSQPNVYAAFVTGFSTEFAVLGAWASTTRRRLVTTRGAALNEELVARPATRLDALRWTLRRHAAYLTLNA